MMFSSRRKSESGFTLIELLVVIAIIAILAAILFPVLTAAKAASLRSSCASQMKQIYQAFSQYSDDRGGTVPPLNYGNALYNPGATDPSPTVRSAADTSMDPDVRVNWINMIEPYFSKSTLQGGVESNSGAFNNAWKLTRCPSCKLDPGHKYSGGHTCTYSYYSTVGYNFIFFSPINSKEENEISPQKLAKPNKPSKTILFVDSKTFDTDDNGMPYPDFTYGHYYVCAPYDLPTTVLYHDDNPDPKANLIFHNGDWMFPTPSSTNANGVVYSITAKEGWTHDKPNGYCAVRHGSNTTVQFADGHVKCMGINELSDPSLWDMY